MSEQLLITPLHALHIEMGGKMVPFAGYDMPVQYKLGVLKEHLHCREKAGLFDVSHMGQIRLIGENAAQALEALVPVDIVDLEKGKQRYAFFTNEQGGILDDFMVSNFGDHLFIVVNAACKKQDINHLKANLPNDVRLEVIDDRALLALQGPLAAKILSQINPAVNELRFMDCTTMQLLDIECYVSRSGYTGEDGFEISVPADYAQVLARALQAFSEVEWIGLGARDSLRLECGLCLYGHDIDQTTTPVEASLLWAMSKVRREDGQRAGGFLGADIILAQIKTKKIKRKRVGLLGISKAPVREGTLLFDTQDNEIGIVTSGSFAPSKGMPVAMAYLDSKFIELGTELYASVRGKKLAMKVEKMPFVAQRYYRG
ncbi:glycine cleavage system aminomethyltransferase GcvT [Psychromonas sp. MME2]|uniref:glycine cleavage system aminomethyltransferase GcvT n=1 Tax=unclassified Psychromonas TaxID=2614957 RepID=UPI00339C1C79